MWVQTAMVVDALRHVPDVLDYLRLLTNQSVFNFCAIPQTMAIATLELCFMNPDMFKRNIKIRKAVSASLIMRATNPRDVAHIFRDFTRKIHQRAVKSDPNFLRLSVACAKIEQWCEVNYPSHIIIGVQPQPAIKGQPAPKAKYLYRFDPTDQRSKAAILDDRRDKAVEARKLKENPVEEGKGDSFAANAKEQDFAEFLMFAGAAFAVVLITGVGLTWFIVQYLDN